MQKLNHVYLVLLQVQYLYIIHMEIGYVPRYFMTVILYLIDESLFCFKCIEMAFFSKQRVLQISSSNSTDEPPYI